MPTFIKSRTGAIIGQLDHIAGGQFQLRDQTGAIVAQIDHVAGGRWIVRDQSGAIIEEIQGDELMPGEAPSVVDVMGLGLGGLASVLTGASGFRLSVATFGLGEVVELASSHFHRPENYDKIRDLPNGKELWAGGNDWENGWTWAGIHVKGSHRGEDDPEKWVNVDHAKCPGCHGDNDPTGRTERKACIDYGKRCVLEWIKKHHSSISELSLIEDVVELATAGRHSPKGGVTINGKHYPGGEFIPGKVMKAATQEERDKVEGYGGGGLFDQPAAKVEEKEEVPEIKSAAHVGELKIEDNVRGHHHGQMDATLTASTSNGKVAAYLDYSVMDGKPLIAMVESTQPGLRAGRQLVKKLVEQYGYENIQWGMMTGDGAKLRDSLDKEFNIERTADKVDLASLIASSGGKLLSEEDGQEEGSKKVYVEFDSTEKGKEFADKLTAMGAERVDVQELNGKSWVEGEIVTERPVIRKKAETVPEITPTATAPAEEAKREPAIASSGQKVRVAGAEFVYVGQNADGTHKLRNAEGNEFDTEPGEDITPLNSLVAMKNTEALLPKSQYVKQELQRLHETRMVRLREVESQIADFINKKRRDLPVGISPTQALLVMSSRDLGDEGRKLATSYRVAKANTEVDTANDRLHHERTHRALVSQSLAAGRPVPPEVLADYPDLAAAAEEAKREEVPEIKPAASLLKIKSVKHAADELQSIRNDLASPTSDHDDLKRRVDAIGAWAAANAKTTGLGAKVLEEANRLADKLEGGSGKGGTRINLSLASFASSIPTLLATTTTWQREQSRSGKTKWVAQGQQPRYQETQPGQRGEPGQRDYTGAAAAEVPGAAGGATTGGAATSPSPRPVAIPVTKKTQLQSQQQKKTQLAPQQQQAPAKPSQPPLQQQQVAAKPAPVPGEVKPPPAEEPNERELFTPSEYARPGEIGSAEWYRKQLGKIRELQMRPQQQQRQPWQQQQQGQGQGQPREITGMSARQHARAGAHHARMSAQLKQSNPEQAAKHLKLAAWHNQRAGAVGRRFAHPVIPPGQPGQPGQPRQPRQGGGRQPTGPVTPAGPVGKAPETAPRGSTPGVAGEDVEIHAAKFDKPIPARYEVREMSDVSPSNDYLTGNPKLNPNYPAELQPREYKLHSEEDAKVRRFAEDKKAAYYLMESPDASNGTPTITPDGTVINGNGRTMALQLAAHKNDYGWYKDELLKRRRSSASIQKRLKG